MDSFFQLHLLIPYGPSNPNRDDTGQPKGALFGGAPRLRISSQSLKRAWRTSSVFQEHLEGQLGERTRRIGEVIRQHLLDGNPLMAEDQAKAVARLVARIFGEVHKENDEHETYTKQLVFVSAEERSRAEALADSFASGERAIGDYDLDRAAKSKKKGVEDAIKDLRNEVLQETDKAADIAMFGRMLAASPAFNREAAVQVSHAITTHRAEAEDDYYSAVDDLKPKKDPEDSGAGFIGEQEFGAGVFYTYICVDRQQFLENVGEGGEPVLRASLSALIKAAATVSPGGKQASFASRARAIYALAENGNEQPRSLIAAFLKPVSGTDQGEASIKALKKFRDQMNAAYDGADPRYYEEYEMDVLAGEGTLAGLVDFAVS